MQRGLLTKISRAAGARRDGLLVPPAPLRRTVRGSLLALVLAFALSLVLLTLRHSLSTANVSLIYLLPVLVGATLGGLIPGVLAAVICAFTFDLLFIQPYGTLSVASGQDALTLLIYLGTGALVAELAGHARARAEEAARRAATNALLYDLSSVFLAGNLDAVLNALVQRLAEAFDLRSCAVLLPDAHGALRDRAHWGPELGITSSEDKRQLDAVATWAFTQGDTVGLSLDRPAPATVYRRGAPAGEPRAPHGRPPKETVLFLPMRTSHARGSAHTTGVLALVRPVATPLAEEETRLLATFATQAALAVDRARLADESAHAAILRESDRAKSTLLSNVSHDLRTPLTTIHGAAESLLAADVQLDEQTRQELLTSIRDDAERLTALVGNLLSLSRLEAGALRPEQHLYNLSEIAGSVLVRLRQQLARHHVRLVLEPDVPPVLVDYTLFEQVLVNLLDNAIKYSPQDTTIMIRLRSEGGDVILSVADEGPGIPRTARNRVFERFYRLPETAAKRGAGTGLGLAICQAVVAAHGGRIWIENGPEPGTTISIALPIQPEPADLGVATAGGER
jgi:two-component system sensor histidine kinase KdpD